MDMRVRLGQPSPAQVDMCFRLGRPSPTQVDTLVHLGRPGLTGLGMAWPSLAWHGLARPSCLSIWAGLA